MTLKNIKKNFFKYGLVVLLAINISIWIENYSFNTKIGLFEFTVLDIGQGDSILVKSPNNLYGLIDSGRGTKVLGELQRHLPLNFRELEFVVITHPDLDHIEGLVEVLKSYSAKRVFINITAKENELIELLGQIILNQGIKNYGLLEANDFEMDGVNFNIIWPLSKSQIFENENSNNVSIGLEIIYKNLNIYSSGDLSSEQEEESVQYLKDNKVEVLKLSHHGSKTSTSKEFLDLINPSIVVIPVGMNNSYGHPSEEVINRINTLESAIFRTDLDQSIKITSNGHDINFITTAGKSKEFKLK